MKTFKQACDYAENAGRTSFFWFVLNWVLDLDTYDDIEKNNKDLFKWVYEGLRRKN